MASPEISGKSLEIDQAGEAFAELEPDLLQSIVEDIEPHAIAGLLERSGGDAVLGPLTKLATTEFDYDTDQYYTLKVENSGSQIRASINGKIVLEANDDAITKGSAFHEHATGRPRGKVVGELRVVSQVVGAESSPKR